MPAGMPDDLMALLGGGGAPAPAGGGAGPMPEDLMALLGGGMGAPAPEEAAGPPSVVDGQPGGGEEALTQAIDLIQVAIDAEADQEDVQVMLQCQTKLQQILAKNQGDMDAAMGGKTSPKAMRKQAASVGAGGGEEGY